MTPLDASTQAEIISLFELRPRTAVVPWLEANISLPAKMAPNSAGPFRTALRPFQRPILECWNPDSGVNHCGVSAGVQIAKTTMLVLGISYRICNSPLPALIVGSSKDWTKTEISEKRLIPLIDENPILAAEKPANTDQYRAMSLAMAGAGINLVGGNSPGALSGGSYGIVAIDEASKLAHQGSDQVPEAHPFMLAEKRTDGFGALEFHYRSSTPNSPTHPFWQYILSGDQTRFHCECPHCRNWFYLDMIGRPEDRDEYTENIGIHIPSHYRSVIWSPDAREKTGQWNETKVLQTATYICPHNGCEVREIHKQPMVDACEEKRHNTLAASNRRSFILPSFYSPTMSIGRMAWAFLESQKDFFGLQDYYNSRLARPWIDAACSVKEEIVRRCIRSDYGRASLPFRPRLLVITADPGEALTHWEVTAIDEAGNLAVVDWGTLLSSRELIGAEFLKHRLYTVPGTGEKIVPHIGYIDSGYLTETQYDICQASGGFYWPTKGSDAKHGSVNETRAASRPDLRLYTYSDKQAKDDLYQNRIARLTTPGFFIPADADASLLLGHSGQMKDKTTEEWKRVPNDHFGDCSKLALIALWIARAAGFIKS